MSDDRYGELREILVGPERARLDAIDQRLDDPGLHVDAVSAVLPEAVARRATDRALGAALGPVVGDAIKASVRRDPQPLVDAIFPIIGPAIRRAIATAFAELSQSINTTLEHAFTPRGMRWRLEAWRTGKTFGEVVLSHSLAFRCEQLFLIHRETGLLLRHLTAPGVKALSPDMVAGMLTAITQFAQDSLEVSTQEGLDSFAFGDLTVWAEQGPAIVLAAVIRGQAPVTYRETLQEAVEATQRVHAEAIEAFGRDGRPVPVRDDLLEPCLVSQQVERARPAGSWRLALAGVLLLAALGSCAVPRFLHARRVDRYLDRLRQEPGIVVGNVGRSSREVVVSGLRDPLAADPRALLGEFGLDTSRITGHWEPYIALRPEFILRRAGAALAVPPGVQLAMRHDTLSISGVAGASWLRRARVVAPAIAGVGSLDLGQLRDSIDVTLAAMADTAESFSVAFDPGAQWPRAGSRAVLDSLARTLGGLVALADSAAREVRVDVHSSTDSAGSEGINRALRESRAQALRSLLGERGVPWARLAAVPDSTSGARHGYIRVHL
ncbi:MAG: OmpA family protein, partial [Gemmatimonadetes bacterium]|nr:OmpA family protein [Gemmatimonadota bacterium]